MYLFLSGTNLVSIVTRPLERIGALSVCGHELTHLRKEKSIPPQMVHTRHRDGKMLSVRSFTQAAVCSVMGRHYIGFDTLRWSQWFYCPIRDCTQIISGKGYVICLFFVSRFVVKIKDQMVSFEKNWIQYGYNWLLMDNEYNHLPQWGKIKVRKKPKLNVWYKVGPSFNSVSSACHVGLSSLIQWQFI